MGRVRRVRPESQLRKIGFHHRESAPQPVPIKTIYEDEISTDSSIHSSRANSQPSVASPDFPFAVRENDFDRRASLANLHFLGPGSQNGLFTGTASQDPFGLHLVSDHADPSADIIFVHGLGGAARKSWCWERKPENFWPEWLAEEDGLSTCRVFTFGYNSNFRGASTNLNIFDFAKDLLFHMLTFSGGYVDECVPIGQRPIIFVAHSMGGLVAKKAYCLGKHDRDYATLISSIFGMIFLATPHRGAQYAKMLNHILSATPLGAPPKAYLSDLETQSAALQDINEQFRTSSEDLSLVSFFETLKTSLGVMKIQIVEKDAGILGYSNEMSCPLNADHHNVCKFKSREDGNYVSVRNLLKMWFLKIRPIRPSLPERRSTTNSETIQKIEAILGIRDRVENDLNALLGRVIDGTCQWITQTKEYVDWVKGSEYFERPKIFWLVAVPGTGKSVLASVVVDQLRLRGEDCLYHFFSAGDQAKRKVAYCLRSVASQLAFINEEFRDRLSSLHEESGLVFSSQNQDFKTLWDKVFEGIIFKIRFPKPLFWVIDGMDEAELQPLLINHLVKIKSLTNIRIFLTSRPMKIPSTSTSFRQPITTYFMSKSDTFHDIWAYVNDVICNILPDDDRIRDDTADLVLSKASGSFLWVKLALETLKDNWHTEDDIQKALTAMPEGMGPLYGRMLGSVTTQSSRQQVIANRILTWAACSWRPLRLAELRIALESEFKGFIKLEDTIVQVCGHFISLDNSKISLIHATARDFLLEEQEGIPAFINSRKGHEHIAISCLEYLSSDNWRRVFKALEPPSDSARGTSKVNRLLIAEKSFPFLGYATCYWAYHVSKSSLDSHHLTTALRHFFASYCLSWVEGIALSTNLRYMTRSAQHLKFYSKRLSRRSNLNTAGSPLSLKHPPENDSKTIQLWAVDLIRIVGKFGPNLIQCPSSIYRIVPTFCPRESMIGRTYGASMQNSISVTGLSSGGWDDCLATTSLGENETASKVLAADSYFVTLHSRIGAIAVWYTETCEQARIIHHGEYVPLMALNRSQSLLATAGIKTFRVWDLSSGEQLYCLQKTMQAATMAIGFGTSNTELYVGLDNCTVMRYDLQSGTWKSLLVNAQMIDRYGGCPRVMAFSPDLTKVVMAWRGKPPLLWDLTLGSKQPPQRCRINHHSDAICAPDMIQWHPDGDSILVLCQNTQLVEWHVYDEEQVQFDHIKAREMTVSQDGNLLLSSDNMGTISIWTFPKLNLLYRLVNENEFIRDLAFSPDGQRFYDTRNSVCNVWEPDALIRSDEQDLEDHSSLGESSILTEPIVSRDESSQSYVTALASDSEDKYYCCGKEDGSVMIYDAITGIKLRKVYSHSSTSSVTALAWSHSGRYMVSADDSGRVIAKRLELKEPGKWGVFAALDLRIDEPVKQLLLNDVERRLLISTASTAYMWNLGKKEKVQSRQWECPQGRRWVQHPLDTGIILCVDPSTIRPFEWSTLDSKEKVEDVTTDMPPESPSSRVSTNQKPLDTDANTETVVHWVASTRDKQYLIYQTLPSTRQSISHSTDTARIRIFQTTNLHNANPNYLIDIIIDTLALRVKHLIGTYQDMLVFLDHDFWLSTWRIMDDANKVERHFFLPRDWVNTGTLQMGTLNQEGTFFCPRRGDVAIVRNGIRF